MTNFGVTTGPDAPYKLRNTYVAHTRLFVIVLLISLVVTYAWILTSAIVTTIQWTTNQLLLLVVLLVVHAALHWLSQYIGRRQWWALAFLVVQGGLLFALSLLLRYPGLLVLEYGALIGEAVTIFESPWLAVLTTVQLYSLYTVSLHLSMAPVPGINVVWGIIVANVLLSVAPSLLYMLTLTLQVRSRREAVHLVKQLDSAHRQLAVYARQVEELTLAAERARMARELHDTLAQGVAGMILHLEALEISLQQGDTARAAQVTSQVKGRARDVLTSSRRAIDDLRLLPTRPSALGDALAEEVARFSALTGITATLDASPSLNLPTALAEHVVRCVSEGLANVARHAHASKVQVVVGSRDTELSIEVHDDGVGFDPAALEGRSGHYGLVGLRERARLMGGILDVDSAVGAGTTLRLRLPEWATEDAHS